MRAYLPGRDRNGLERALRIPALSAGWRGSFETLLDEDAMARRPAIHLAPRPRGGHGPGFGR